MPDRIVPPKCVEDTWYVPGLEAELVTEVAEIKVAHVNLLEFAVWRDSWAPVREGGVHLRHHGGDVACILKGALLLELEAGEDDGKGGVIAVVQHGVQSMCCGDVFEAPRLQRPLKEVHEREEHERLALGGEEHTLGLRPAVHDEGCGGVEGRGRRRDFADARKRHPEAVPAARCRGQRAARDAREGGHPGARQGPREARTKTRMRGKARPKAESVRKRAETSLPPRT